MMQKISYQLCNKLYRKGFRERDRKVSKEFSDFLVQIFENLFRNEEKPIIFVLVGSLAEGTGMYFENDIDVLSYYDFGNLTAQDLGSYETVLFMDMRNSPAGYTKISISKATVEGCEEKEEIERSGVYLTHDMLLKNRPAFLDIVGPSFRQNRAWQVSTPLLQLLGLLRNKESECFFQEINLAYDYVTTIKCRSETIITSWVTRKRLHQWPSPEIIEQVSSMPGNLAPVGPGKTDINPENEYLFRVCFSAGELKLVESLNETQILLYIFLKKLFKQETGRDSKCMTSYIIKNIVLWLAESVRPLYFQLKFFFPVIYATLRTIKWMVESKHIIPNYMIPGRNMLNEKLDEHHQCILIAKLTSWLEHAHEQKPFGVIDLADIPDTAPDETKESVIDGMPRIYYLTMKSILQQRTLFNKLLTNPSTEMMTFAYALMYFIKEEHVMKYIESTPMGALMDFIMKDVMEFIESTPMGACMTESEKENVRRESIALKKLIKTRFYHFLKMLCDRRAHLGNETYTSW